MSGQITLDMYRVLAIELQAVLEDVRRRKGCRSHAWLSFLRRGMTCSGRGWGFGYWKGR